MIKLFKEEHDNREPLEDEMIELMNDDDEKDDSKKKTTSSGGIRKKKEYQGEIRVRKVKVYPTTKQREKLNQWMGAVRWTYNRLVEKYKDVSETVSITELRDHVNSKQVHEEFPWLNNVPGEVRDTAVCDFVKAKDAYWKKIQKNQEINNKNVDLNALKTSKFKYRSKKKDNNQSFEVRARDWGRSKASKYYHDLFHHDNIDSNGKLPKGSPEATIRVVREYTGNYY